MNQCQTCFRFNTNLQNKCCYCNSQKLEKFKPTENKSIYKINIGEIIIKNKEYKIAELIDRGGFGTVLKVKSDNKFYALKVQLIFDELFTNNKSNSE